MILTPEEMVKVQTYLQQLFWNPEINVQKGTGVDAPAEVYVGKEFIGVVYKNDDDGEISYDWNMSILPEDIEGF
ncbi:MAG: DUF3126 family protein [Alphaproteobacteria bacterium]|nr:DUF3126 family protein [Alphaproteobacteria bacterium]MBQ3117404.1 DUF3126 family protein [Alphaproteobacteria bacterium]MBQ6854832.1 DUF3126 family protein [Alphaproteobacteria bacterium]MBQ8558051.1 DUF3126 family protein [Alphaproteobacteria bacterium]MBR3913438.1 DUF3126 family protein [Alphaproteobacteria bacterium]